MYSCTLGLPIFFVDSDGKTQPARLALGTQACRTEAPASGGGGDAGPPIAPAGKCTSCLTVSEFQDCAHAVTAECCNEPQERCTNGQPMTCNAGCAKILLPMIAACKGLLAQGVLHAYQAPLQTAAAKCSTPLQSCTSLPEYVTLSRTVSNECCGVDFNGTHHGSPCNANGFPTESCSAACSTALHGLHIACSGFFQANPIFVGPIKAALQLCDNEH